MSELLALSALLTLAPACGPVTYLSRVTFSAYGDMEALRVTDTEKWSPYEFTAANEYLRRSQELAGYARHHDSNNFAKKAQTNIKDAKTVATRRKKGSEFPIYNPNDPGMYITKDGLVKRKSSLDYDNEKPPGLDNEKPPLTQGEIDAKSKKEGK
ncbi:MAG TPA: hypothetical protein PKI03_29910 [Pseudomonadota bacterium]|nr:hypothetical protein [Pseudomonadota bacterium]